MANANVEKLKDLGLRHGEKAAVAVFGAVCLLLLFLAWTYPVIEMTPDEVEKAAQQANQNIQRRQDEDQILAKLQGQGVVLQNFEQVVDARQPGSMDPSQFRLPNLMAAREPGAGLLREEPDLIAVASLDAHAGRGAINVIALDEITGRPIWEKPKTDEEEKDHDRSSGGKEKSEIDKQKEREKKARAQAEALAAITGDVRSRGLEEEGSPEDTASTAGLVPKEILKGYRWVALTGTLDNTRFRENFAKALKVDLAGAYPNYLRMELERQELLSNGEWSDWEPVDRQKSIDMVYKIMTVEDAETTPKGLPLTDPSVRLDALVDPLPFLEVGSWYGVHPGELVSKEAIKELMTEPKEEDESTGDMMGMGDMGMEGGMMSEGAMEMEMGEMMMGPASEFGTMFGGPAGDTIDTNFPKSEAEKLMVRALDFTVRPDAIYRYRMRLVVANPNHNSSSVMPGVDVASEDLVGPWSEPTGSVQVPADVAAYVVDYAPDSANPNRNDVVRFEMVRWVPETGLTITRTQSSAPGQVVGEKMSSQVPDIINKKLKSQNVDFTSHRVLLDTAGGKRPISNLGLGSSHPEFDAPALALVLRTDGTLVLRDQAVDTRKGGDMEEMKDIYKKEQEDAKEDKDKDSSVMGIGEFGG